ncbi:hypothetical protein J2W49_004725 [Hydrogenophaga palleronii]|uniref:Uncharacterized protein n=1 Tax=Hydrogenophaga palleronii TaxID=65655 RepID=A0ABU1WV67_9BURK|nr:hypothetical protein [Hydrogenophaga palleronii]MDR7152747.1 hypothetical protein [Hydrogenophaga palleronii]
MKNIKTIVVVLLVGCISGMAGCSTSRAKSDNSEDIRLWYAFTSQTLDFMMEVADPKGLSPDEKINEKVMLTFADAAYFLDAELMHERGVRHLKGGMCNRLPQLRNFWGLIEGGVLPINYRHEASRNHVARSLQGLITTLDKICDE